MGSSHSNPLSLTKCKELLKGKDSKKLCNNTYLDRLNQLGESEVYGVTLYNTRIITLSETSLKIQCRGHMTKTTRERLSWFLPMGFNILIKGGLWTLIYCASGYGWNDPTARVLGIVPAYGPLVIRLKKSKTNKALPAFLNRFKTIIESKKKEQVTNR